MHQFLFGIVIMLYYYTHFGVNNSLLDKTHPVAKVYKLLG